jgi:hypothetical protein
LNPIELAFSKVGSLLADSGNGLTITRGSAYTTCICLLTGSTQLIQVPSDDDGLNSPFGSAWESTTVFSGFCKGGELGRIRKSVANAVADFMGVTVHVDNVSGRVESLVPNLENSLEHFSLLEIHDRRHADRVGCSEK